MTERYLFRGKQLRSGEWLFGDLNHLSGTYIFPRNTDALDSTDRYEVDPDTLGQYTGLKDKNSKLIFECDILLDEYDRTWSIIWARGCFMLRLIHDPYPRDDDDYDTWPELLSNFWSGYVEIIGNIHDNPELLGKDGELIESL